MILMRGRALESVLVFGKEQSTVCIYITLLLYLDFSNFCYPPL